MDLARIRSDDGLQPKPTSTFKITKFSQLSSTFLNATDARIQPDDGLITSLLRVKTHTVEKVKVFCNGASGNGSCSDRV